MDNFDCFMDFDEFENAGFVQKPENEGSFESILDLNPTISFSDDEEWSMDSSYQNLDVPHHSPPPSPTPHGQIEGNLVQIQEPVLENEDRDCQGRVQDAPIACEDLNPIQDDLQNPILPPQLNWIEDFVAPVSAKKFQEIARSQGERTIQREGMFFYDPEENHFLEDDLQDSGEDETPQIVDNGGPGARIQYLNVHGPPTYNGRPPFRLKIYGAMAVINSPSQHITASDVKNFILHHFPWFRSFCKDLKTSLASMLRKDEDFVFKGLNNHNIYLYTLKNLEIPTLKTREELYIERDNSRSHDFYERVFNGDVGLPREMFYRFIGKQHHLAGPENSALFYHLLAHKLDPRIFKNAFREHTSVPSGKEPKFGEDLPQYDVEVQNWPYYGVSLPVGAAPRVMSSEDVTAFFEKIESYFNLQKRGKAMGILNWETPILH
ncbi:hypothetical protein B9Z55_028278 [Caenorhabditis nigoni]|uniref:Fork-head domain-containing protein n=1 Tax=Caenorhabditis nigoni TaxID=1611254 RepID=A0A2G5SCG0_9PELO|nr:hypothetical protein B9Z55_028278 [Caenorhabditis nigoni]